MSIWTDENGRLHVGVMVRGRRFHRRLQEGASKGDAKQLEAELRRAAGLQRNTARIPGDPPLTEIMALYMSHAESALRSPKTAQYHAVRIGPWCDGRKASEAEDVARRALEDMRGHYRAATINRSLGAMKKALSLAWARGLIPENYGSRIARIPENNKRHVYLSVDGVAKIADKASETVRAAIWIALLTGCRRGEILKLVPEDLHGGHLRIRAGNTKTLRERTIPVVPALRPWLSALPLKITADGLKSGFARARRRAGIEANFHDLRHSCASILINAGTPLEVIRDILGHTTVKTTERYAHLVVGRQHEALMKISDIVERGAA